LVGEEELRSVADVLRSGWLTQGPRVAEFESRLADYVGVEHAVAVHNCTEALHLALLAHGIGPGDEVVVPSYTWIATPNVVRMAGATPIFADIDIATFNVTPEEVEAATTERTRAVMPVHQFGMPADVDAIADVARRHDLVVVEDAACALGSRYRHKAVGSCGNTACFSFHPRKLITTGEGGMLVTQDATAAEAARALRNHGASVSDVHKHRAGTVEALLSEHFPGIGYNYRMTDLQAAVGICQMARLPEVVSRRRALAKRYDELLSATPWILPPEEPDYAESNWQSYAVRVSRDAPLTRDELAQRLLNAGITCRPAYMACHVQPIYANGAARAPLTSTEEALRSVLVLPLYSEMTGDEQEYVVHHITRSSP